MTFAVNERIKTNKILMDICNFDKSLFDTSTLSYDEIKYYNSITRGFDKQIQFFIDWLDSDEARRIFYENESYNEQVFDKIEDEIKEIVGNTSLTADEIISRIYDSGLQAGADEIKRTKYYNDATKFGLHFLQDYNFELIKNINTDLANHIRAEIFTGIAAGESMPEVAKRILTSTNNSLTGKTLTARQRAMMIARTETARAMTQGRLQSYTNYGVQEVKILTAGDKNVCATCREAEAKIYPITEAANLVPFHPLCRCSVRAYIRHGILQGSPDSDAQVMNLSPNSLENTSFLFGNSSNSNNMYNYKSSKEEYNDISKKGYIILQNGSEIKVKCSKNFKLELDLINDEIVYKYDFGDVIIYKSKNFHGIPVEKIYDYYNSIKYKKIKQSCNEIVITKQYYEDEIYGIVEGFVHPEHKSRLHVLSPKFGSVSLYTVKYTLFHEISHCFDKNGIHSLTDEFKDTVIDDFKNPIYDEIGITQLQRFISDNLKSKLIYYEENEMNMDENKKKLLQNDIFSEIFADTLSHILLFGSETFNELHKNKINYINKIIKNN